MYDIAIPQYNEEELAKKYIERNIKKVIFGYYIKNRRDLEIFKLENIFYFKKIDIYYLAIVENKNFKETLKLASDLFYSEDLYNDLIFIKGYKLEDNSKLLNNYYFNGIFLEDLYSKEKFYFTNLDKFCFNKIKKNNQSLLISLKNAIQDPYSYIFLFNILKKRDIPFLYGSFASDKSEVPGRYEIKAFYKVFGIRNSLITFDKILFKQVKRTRIAKNKLYFNKDFYILKLPFEDCCEF
ncbi:MAG: hypothetical protein QW038_01280 [Nanopusillaceae archaeon]